MLPNGTWILTNQLNLTHWYTLYTLHWGPVFKTQITSLLSPLSLSGGRRFLRLFVCWKVSLSYQNHHVNRALVVETCCEEINVKSFVKLQFCQEEVREIKRTRLDRTSELGPIANTGCQCPCAVCISCICIFLCNICISCMCISCICKKNNNQNVAGQVN